MKKSVILGISLIAATLMADGDFNRIKEMESHSHQERIQNLQKADNCINSAQDKESYKKCEMEEKQNRESMRNENFAQKKSMMIQRIDEHMQRGAAAKNCISAANSPEDLKKCMPEKRKEGQGERFKDSPDRQ